MSWLRMRDEHRSPKPEMVSRLRSLSSLRRDTPLRRLPRSAKMGISMDSTFCGSSKSWAMMALCFSMIALRLLVKSSPLAALWAAASSMSVIPLTAETTAIVGAGWLRMMRLTSSMLFAVPMEVPPNLRTCTMNVIKSYLTNLSYAFIAGEIS